MNISRTFATTCITLATILPVNLQAQYKSALIVHADAVHYMDETREQTQGCGLLMTATSINGDFISAVIRLQNETLTDKQSLEYIVTSGNINYNNGMENFDYVREAWFESDTIETRSMATNGRGTADYAFSGKISNDRATELFTLLLHEPFTIYVDNGQSADAFSHTFENAFDNYVIQIADPCLQAFRQ